MPEIDSSHRLISWNVNGLRAVLAKGFAEFVASALPDVLCLQETKALPDQIDDWSWSEGYDVVWNPAEKKGYAGTAVLSRLPVREVTRGLGREEHDGEGRVITLEFDSYFLVNVYTPNSQDGLRRLPYRQQWDRDFRDYVRRLEQTKPVIICGDLNVAHEEIDIARPQANRKSPGFSDEEREGFSALLEAGFIDSFRHFHPGEPGHYTWWSYRADSRARNVGWRLDYFLVSKLLSHSLRGVSILRDVKGSDHCPVAVCLR